ncbi:hypothetical protein GUITHDRAFT_115928 [Guillardia theta CCMP2712]|uniref:DEP domain-containing protein n=2 Tax=Guillardia theta TaxID=55529 RepID=L1IPF8_GUITC|nr:hypothetical protein GUITHDRAFT_115928 [Guillardia theta CCMP2712]EKX37957.1 hypothetical protein GUITHDRAFT_115928 [Guillardia theta CCMP2712]|eukprot:XP_005824937.1 hypothetical protein GUITHDRAFT_115928 [Guillardia theta CCMP2712]
MAMSSSLPKTVLFWLLKNWFLPTLILLVGRPELVLSYVNAFIVHLMDFGQTYGYQSILILVIGIGVFIKYIMPPALGVFISFLARRFLKVSVGSMAFLRLRKVTVQDPVPFLQQEQGSRLYFEEIVLSTKYFQAKESRRKKYFALILRGIELRGTVNLSALAKGSKAAEKAKAPAEEESRSGGMINDMKRLVIGILKPFLSRFIAWMLASWVELIVIDANVVLQIPGMDSIILSMKELTLFSEDGPDRRMSIEMITEKISVWHEEDGDSSRNGRHLDGIEEAEGDILPLKSVGSKRVRSSTLGMFTNLHRPWESADEKRSMKTRLLLINSFTVGAQCSITISSASLKCVSVFVGQTSVSCDSDVVLRAMNVYQNWKMLSLSRIEREDSQQAGLEAEVSSGSSTYLKHPQSPARLGFESLMRRSGRGQEESLVKKVGSRLASRARLSIMETLNSPDVVRRTSSAVARSLFRSSSMGMQADMAGASKLTAGAEQKRGGQKTTPAMMVNKLKQNMHLLPDCISFKFETISFALAMQSSKLDRGMMNNDRVMLKVELSSHNDKEMMSELRIDREILLVDSGEGEDEDERRGEQGRDQHHRVHQVQVVLSDMLRLQVSESCIDFEASLVIPEVKGRWRNAVDLRPSFHPSLDIARLEVVTESSLPLSTLDFVDMIKRHAEQELMADSSFASSSFLFSRVKSDGNDVVLEPSSDPGGSDPRLNFSFVLQHALGRVRLRMSKGEPVDFILDCGRPCPPSETCSLYVHLKGLLKGKPEPLGEERAIGEVSGILVSLERRSMSMLLEAVLPLQRGRSGRSHKSKRKEKDVAVPFRIHFQNVRLVVCSELCPLLRESQLFARKEGKSGRSPLRRRERERRKGEGEEEEGKEEEEERRNLSGVFGICLLQGVVEQDEEKNLLVRLSHEDVDFPQVLRRGCQRRSAIVVSFREKHAGTDSLLVPSWEEGDNELQSEWREEKRRKQCTAEEEGHILLSVRSLQLQLGAEDAVVDNRLEDSAEDWRELYKSNSGNDQPVRGDSYQERESVTCQLSRRLSVDVRGVRVYWESSVQFSLLILLLQYVKEALEIRRRQDMFPHKPEWTSVHSGREQDGEECALEDKLKKLGIKQFSLSLADVIVNLQFSPRAIIALRMACWRLDLMRVVVDKEAARLLKWFFCCRVSQFAAYRLRGSVWDAEYEEEDEVREEEEEAREPSIAHDKIVELTALRAMVPLEVASAKKAEYAGPDVVFHCDDLKVNVPFPANITLHGRQEGLRGRWEDQPADADKRAAAAELGLVMSDVLLVMKGLLLLAKSFAEEAEGSEKNKHKVTGFPPALPWFRGSISNISIRVEDDRFEVWMSAFYRLQLDESRERERREAILEEKLAQQVVGNQLSAQAAEKLESLARARTMEMQSRCWKERVDKFSLCDYFRDPPPLLNFTVGSLAAKFKPLPPAHLEKQVEALDLSGINMKSGLWPIFDMIVGAEVEQLTATSVCVRIRDYSEPLLATSSLNVTGKKGKQLKGYIIATEEVAPATHRTVVEKVAYGPCYVPGIGIISMVASCLFPPGMDPSPPLSSWDKARMLLHGSCDLHMDKASLRLLSDKNPYEARQCFQMRAEPVTITYECSSPSPSPSIVSPLAKPSSSTASQQQQQQQQQRVGRIHIDVEMVEWAIQSMSKEMASYMLLRKPFFKAVRMNITVSLHWNCLGSPFEHHLTQMVSETMTRANGSGSPPPPPHLSSSSYPDRISRNSSEISEFEDAISAVDDSQWDAPSSHPAGEDEAEEGGEEAGGGVLGSNFDTFRSFRSSALALTSRLSTFAAHSVLHLNTIRWLKAFMSAFEMDADPVIRFTGKVEERSGKCWKVANVKSSFGKHVKAMNIMLLSKNLELDCFYVGEHREFAGEAAAAKSTVLAFTGESLQVNTRVERSSLSLGGEQQHEDAVDDLENATGSWQTVDTSLRMKNLVVAALPPVVGEDLTVSPAHPIASAVEVEFLSGESLQTKGKSQVDSLSPQRTNRTASITRSMEAKLSKDPSNLEGAEMHQWLLRQHSILSWRQRRRSAQSPQPAQLSVSSLQQVLSSLVKARLIHDHTYRFKVYHRVFLGTQFVDWCLQENWSSSREEAVVLGQSLMDEKLIRRVPQSPHFEDSPTFYRIRESVVPEQTVELDSNSWSKVWGSQRPGRAKLKEEQGMVGNEDPSFKLILRGLCLQWTSEIREIMRDWQVLYTLATRSHVSRRYPVIDCSSSPPAESSPSTMTSDEEARVSPALAQPSSSSAAMLESEAGVSLVEHLIKTSMLQTSAYVESSQGKDGERGFTSILTSPRGEDRSTTSNIVSSIALLKNKMPKRCDVRWIVQFLDAQLGVETGELAGPGSGAERVIVHAESGTMKLLYFDFSSGQGVGGEGNKSDTEIRLLEMSNLQAFVVEKDREADASAGRGEPSSIVERWGTTVWRTKEQGADLLQPVLSIEGLDERGRPDPTGTAMSLSLSKAVTDLIGSQTQTNAPKESAGEQAGSEVEVLFFNLKLATDTSQFPPLLNCLKDMMTPVSADKFMAEETRNMRHMVQLMPQVALDLEKMKEDQLRLLQEIESLQNRYADIERQQLSISSEARGQDGELRAIWKQQEKEKFVLGNQLAEKREGYAQVSKKITALTTASEASEQKDRIGRITLQVKRGSWLIGPREKRIANLSIRGVRFSQLNNVALGVPIDYTFRLSFLQIESLLEDPWNADFRQVLGPLYSKDDFNFVDDKFFNRSDSAMLSVHAEQLAKPEGDQVVFSLFSVEIYPIKIQITEDLYNGIYTFFFPGKWKVNQGLREWEHEGLPLYLYDKENRKVVLLEQKRQFYHVVKKSARPSLTDDSNLFSVSSATRRKSVDAFAGVDQVRDGEGKARLYEEASFIFPAGEGSRFVARTNKDVEEMKLRARDHIEFNDVRFLSCLRQRGLEVSISYKSRKGAIPDIDNLVVELPDVNFPKERQHDGAIVCTWQELYHMWLHEVKWPVISQVTRSIWDKVKWRRRAADTSFSGMEAVGKERVLERKGSSEEYSKVAKSIYSPRGGSIHTEEAFREKEMLQARSSYLTQKSISQVRNSYL